ncbi:complement factor B-like isoform X2 [Amblyomma americanum]
MTAATGKMATLGLASSTVALLLLSSPCFTLPQMTPCSIQPPDIANGSYVELKEARLAMYNCSNEFRLGGPSNLTCVPSSDGKDTWLPDPDPECVANQNCSEIDLKHGGYEGDCCSPGHNVTFYCDDERFHLVGAEEATCQENGAWSAMIPICKDTYCKDPGVSPEGHRLIVLKNEIYEGECCPPETTIYYECNYGYNLEGEKNIRCGLNGNWSDHRPMCRRFRVNGKDQLRCKEAGQWDSDIPTCVESKCTRFKPGPHLQVDEFKDMHKTQFTEGTFINFRCGEGYLLKGAFSSVCRNGRWSGRIPKCKQIRCGFLRTPRYGWMSGNHSTAVGATASFGCFNGYVLLGSEKRQCDDDGQWNGTPVRCVPKRIMEARNSTDCLDPGTPDNGFPVGRRTRSKFSVGTDVTFSCNTGYHMRGNATISCLSSGKWSGSLPRCIGEFYYDKRRFVGRALSAVAVKIPELNASTGNDSDARQRILIVKEPDAPRHFVYFLFDASDSIGPQNFQTGINLAKAITRKVKVTDEGHRVGAIVFTNEALLKIDPTEIKREDLVLKGLGSINYTGGGTSIKAGLEKLKNSVANVKSRHTKIKFAAFLISDGKANIGGDAYKEGNLLKQSGVEMYCIGITGQLNNDELNRLASKEENVLLLHNYDALQWIAEKLTNGTIDYSECGLSYTHNPESGFAVDDSAAGRILGGAEVKTVWPWMVQIQIKDKVTKKPAVCGGTIIDRKWVLTAAHCTHTIVQLPEEPRNYEPDELSLVAGLKKTNSGTAKKLVVEKIVRHEGYNASSKTFLNDIALLKLKDEIVYEKSVRPVCLPPSEEKKHKKSSEKENTAFVIGWGADKPKHENPTDSLMQLKMEIGSRDDCNKSVQGHAGKVYPEQGLICAKSTEGDTCIGDSGGPLMRGVKDEEVIWTQTGIVSWGQAVCKKNKHSFYTDVSHYMDWIQHHLKNGTAPVANV